MSPNSTGILLSVTSQLHSTFKEFSSVEGEDMISAFRKYDLGHGKCKDFKNRSGQDRESVLQM